MNETDADDIATAKAGRFETRRATVPALEALLFEPIPVLDHGFIRVVDYMGDDAAVVQAARVSYGRGTKKLNEDRGLIRYLMRHWHTTPFEMTSLKLHVKLPVFVARRVEDGVIVAVSGSAGPSSSPALRDWPLPARGGCAGKPAAFAPGGPTVDRQTIGRPP